ncbi:AfsR/SARP family transcriptional regulator [Streptomyces sp. SBT349]|uniref:AfsR/SARP family transcriptional regulator n=1 Tax=Streptomyces sp. SBT349 TaxID=1580539 RepID=UPI00131B3BAF|nr:BTAD domain-containing putative transcriptional regulator [Streptomyces sp. SBT349]
MGSSKERCVLASMLAVAGEPISVDELKRRVWDGDPPPSATGSLQSHISRLRNRLSVVGDRVSIDFTARTYRLEVEPEAVDLLRFRRLHRQAKAVAENGDGERAAELLAEAEALWRGEPLSEFDGHWATALRVRLGEERRRVHEARVQLELGLGRHADLLGELREMAERHPVTESAAHLLMLALYRSGRYAESLGVFHRTRRRLRDELGFSPSEALADLHQRILTRDATLLAPELDRPVTPGSGAPDTMLRDNPDFTGREEELRVLLGETRGTALPLYVVHGMPGIGKTTLAVRAAHLLRERFPDGSLYVDLRAFNRERQPPRDPSDALAALLHAIGADDKLPATLDERSARWREALAHRRVLVVLDDARDAAQVRPLLPGMARCCVILTSRNRMADLEGVLPVPLGVPPAAEAAALFTRIAGEARASDTTAVGEAVDRCERHPLAIQLTANRFRHREAWAVSDLVDRLALASEPLDEIDAPPGIAPAFDLSYSELDAHCRWLFRCLALHPGPDLTLHAATALTGSDVAVVRRGLDELLDNNLIDEPVRDRYVAHGLVRAFAGRLGRRDDAPLVRRKAVERLLDYYLATADAADRLAHPRRRRPSGLLGRLPSGVAPPLEQDAAEAWLDAERANLLAVTRFATAESPHHARYFPLVLAEVFRTWGVWEAAAELLDIGVAHWRELDDPLSLARILLERTQNLWLRGEPDAALSRVAEAMELYQGAGDEWGQAESLAQRALIELVSGRFASAAGAFDGALTLHRRVGNARGEAESLYQQAVVFAYMGRRQESLDQSRTALELMRAIGDRRGELKALNNIGEVLSLLGHNEEARRYYEESLLLVRRIGGRQELAILSNNLGNLCRDTGDPEAALEYLRMALSNYRAIRDQRCEADSLTNIGLTFHAMGQFSEAIAHHSMAETIARRIGDLFQRQRAVAGLAAAQGASGSHRAAQAAYEDALRIAQRISAPYEEARAAEGLGLALVATGQAVDAGRYWLHALELYERLEGAREEAEAVRRRLATHGTRR